MSSQFLHITELYFSYPQASEALFSALNLTFARGWTAVAGANGSGKSTLLKLICGDLAPGSGSIGGPKPRVYCPQEVLEPPDRLEEFYQDFYAGLAEAGRLFALLEMDYDWPYRWETLSFGERKRAQIAAALYGFPEVLLLDEPANHLDEHAVELLSGALSEYRGIGLLVSHDRNLMDSLCSSTLLLNRSDARLFSCSWSTAAEELQREEDHARSTYRRAKTEEKRLKAELQRRREENDRHRKDFSKRGLDKKDFDRKGLIDQARISGKNAIGEKLIRRMDARVQRFSSGIEAPPAKLKTGVSFAARAFRSDAFFSLPPGNLALGAQRSLSHPELTMTAGEKIVLTGVNGGGKTTLIRHIMSAWNLESADFLYLPQEYSRKEIARTLSVFRELESDDRAEVMSHFTRLNGDPKSMLFDPQPSPGELRKLAIAMGFFRRTPLIVLDEPTNHLDLPSIGAIETALKEFDGAILLVSHDRRFREAVCTKEWRCGGGKLSIH
jgi:macrolide transport system ATP-binding/permease protein